MTTEEKLAMVKTIMGADAPDDDTILSYLALAKNEILQWRYSYNSESMPDDVESAYDITQVQSVVNGMEGESTSIENGIHRHFAYSDMVRYIRGNVIALAKV